MSLIKMLKYSVFILIINFPMMINAANLCKPKKIIQTCTYNPKEDDVINTAEGEEYVPMRGFQKYEKCMRPFMEKLSAYTDRVYDMYAGKELQVDVPGFFSTGHRLSTVKKAIGKITAETPAEDENPYYTEGSEYAKKRTFIELKGEGIRVYGMTAVYRNEQYISILTLEITGAARPLPNPIQMGTDVQSVLKEFDGSQLPVSPGKLSLFTSLEHSPDVTFDIDKNCKVSGLLIRPYAD